VTVHGRIRERPDITVEPHFCSLKLTSKLVFLSEDHVEKILLKNLSFNGAKKELIVNKEKALEMLRDCDVNSTKRKITEIKCKLVIPQTMLDMNIEE
jgi:hypothetical protein